MKILSLLFISILWIGNVFAQESLPLSKTEEYHNYTYTTYLDSDTKEYLTKRDFVKKFGRDEFNIIDAKINNRISMEDQTKTRVNGYTLRLKPSSAVAGGSMIGGSFAIYALSNSIINKKIADAASDANVNKVKSLNDTQRIINYACAGISLVGVVVLISGLHKEYKPGKGFGVSDNVYINGDAGLSMSLTF